jgi:hypothetical protein
VSWNLPNLSQLWRCNGGFGPSATQTNYGQNRSWEVHEITPEWLPVRFAAHRQPLYWNFMYHSRTVLSVVGSVWHMVRNFLRTVTTDSVLAHSKTQNAFFFPVHAKFRHDCPLAVKSASTPRRLVTNWQFIDIYFTVHGPSNIKSVNNFHSTLHKLQTERRSHLYSDMSLKQRIFNFFRVWIDVL